MTIRTSLILSAAVTVVATSLFGCGSRPESWDTTASVDYATGLASTFTLVDESVHVTSLLTVDQDLALHQSRQQVGVSVADARPSPNGDRLFVLSRGVQPHRLPSDERPALWVYDGKGSGQLLGTYPLADALGGLAIDPLGQFVVVYAAGATNSFVENPNELIIIDTTLPASDTNPVKRTIQSFGGRPQRLTFTSRLQLPAGERRLLVVETEQDISLLDLDHLDRAEDTVRLSETGTVIPAAVAYTAGQADRLDDSRIAVRTTSENSIYVLTLTEQTDPTRANDFKIEVNIVGLTSVPTDFGFVNTDAGLRLAALQPNARKATLVDPDTGVLTDVDMPSAFGRMAVVTEQVADAPSTGADVALLWGGGSSSATGVAFWSLGKSVGQAYRSIEALADVAASVTEVVDVPAPNDDLKILVPNQIGSAGGKFHVLNLSRRTAAPLHTTASDLSLTVSSDGQRAWFYQEGSYNVAVVDLATLHPQPLVMDRPIWRVFDIARLGGGRAMVALHKQGTFGATVLDAVTPDEATATRHVGLLQGGF